MILVAALCWGSVALADGGFSVGLEGGVMEFDSRASLDTSGVSWGLRGGIGLFGPARLEARFLSATHDQDTHSASVREGSAQLRLAFIPHSSTTPYAFGGIGLRMTDTTMPGAKPSDSVLVVPVGAGFDLPLADYLILAPEFTWHHLLGDSQDPMAPSLKANDSWNLALVLRLEV
jgi:hypothetical protein